jgi:hypothetical protein
MSAHGFVPVRSTPSAGDPSGASRGFLTKLTIISTRGDVLFLLGACVPGS